MRGGPRRRAGRAAAPARRPSPCEPRTPSPRSSRQARRRRRRSPAGHGEGGRRAARRTRRTRRRRREESWPRAWRTYVRIRGAAPPSFARPLMEYIRRSMTWYEFWLFFHVTAVIVWVGGGAAIQVFGILTKRAADPAKTAFFAQNVSWTVQRVLLP